MTATIEANTQAILLLTSPLLGGAKRGGSAAADPLSLGEYNELARALHERKRVPADLLSDDAATLIAQCRGTLDAARIERLVARGFALAQATELWHARSIWVVSRAEPSYPRPLKARFKESAPPVLYGCGDVGLCESGGLAIVGSRDATDEQLRFAEDAARTAARFAYSVVSGGARGIDQAAMSAALDEGGNVVGMLADGLARAAVERSNRDALRSGRLALLSICDPSAGFHTGFAMQRNRLIYALADAGLVVNAEFEKGGTWAGAVEQLDRFQFVPIYLRACGDLGKGMTALRERGALPWPHPQTADELERALTASSAPPRTQPQLPFAVRPANDEVREPRDAWLPHLVANASPELSPADELLAVVRKLLSAITEPKTEAEVTKLLGVGKPQAKAWLTQLVAEGVLEKTKRPVRYRWVQANESGA